MMIFFFKSLGIQKDKINEFLIYCDENFPSKFFKKDKEFELIDFLVKQSKNSTELLVKVRIFLLLFFSLFYHSPNTEIKPFLGK